MNTRQTQMFLATDSHERAERYRIKLVETLNKRPNIPAEEALDRLSQAYALIGNLQYELGKYIDRDINDACLHGV